MDASCAHDCCRLSSGLFGRARRGQPGDYLGVQGLEALLNSLAQSHQPVFVPTAPEARDGLPRLKVPSPSEAAAAARSAAAVGACGGDSAPSRTSSGGGDGASAQAQHAACKAGDSCTVCRDEYQAGGEVVQLPCRHCFHEECIMPWLEQVPCCCPSSLPHKK